MGLGIQVLIVVGLIQVVGLGLVGIRVDLPAGLVVGLVGRRRVRVTFGRCGPRIPCRIRCRRIRWRGSRLLFLVGWLVGCRWVAIRVVTSLGLVVVGLVGLAAGVGLAVVLFGGRLGRGLGRWPLKRLLPRGGRLRPRPLVACEPVGPEPWARRWAPAATRTMRTVSTSGRSSSRPMLRRPSGLMS